MTDNDWEGYGTCPVCHVAPDEPCFDTDSWDQQEKAKAHRTRGLLTDDPIYQRAIQDAVKRLEALMDPTKKLSRFYLGGVHDSIAALKGGKDD